MEKIKSAEVKSNLSLRELERRLDDAFKNRTTHSLTEWLISDRQRTIEALTNELTNLNEDQSEVKAKIQTWNKTLVRNRGRISYIEKAIRELRLSLATLNEYPEGIKKEE